MKYTKESAIVQLVAILFASACTGWAMSSYTACLAVFLWFFVLSMEIDRVLTAFGRDDPEAKRRGTVNGE